jgi:hypothetical protein
MSPDHDTGPVRPGPADPVPDPVPVPTPADPGADPLAERIAELVAQRRAAGRYPLGLDAELATVHTHALRRALEEFEERLSVANAAAAAVSQLPERPFVLPEVGSDSSIPGGAVIHKVASVLLTRYMQVTVTQLNDVFGPMREALVGVAQVLPLLDEFRREVLGQLDAVEQQLAAVARALAAVPDAG